MNVLFVCTGNTCRSPMAVAIARRFAIARGLPELEITSAGSGALADSAASDGALLVSLEQGTDLSAHRSRPLTARIVGDADLILGMSRSHVERAIELGGAGKSHLLTSFASDGGEGAPVSDPFGADLSVYRRTYAELEIAVERMLDRLQRDGRLAGA